MHSRNESDDIYAGGQGHDFSTESEKTGTSPRTVSSQDGQTQETEALNPQQIIKETEQIHNRDHDSSSTRMPATTTTTCTAADCNSVLNQLQNPEQLRLLNAIDKLRSENISAEIHIPQVVVCGIQSSGKSAVLEAISHLPFPSGSGTNTRFATELVLRTSSKVSVSASIEPYQNRDLKSSEAMKKFQGLTSSSIEDFGDLHQQARNLLAKYNQGKTFWFDKLRIEVSGPEQPHLTLVDLPGLISASPGKASSTDRQDIEELVMSYIRSPRAIVVAVVAAKMDPEVQDIIRLLDGNDNVRARTLGVITYLDMPMTNDSKKDVMKLAQNGVTGTGLGWHLLCNLDHEATDRSALARERHEKQHLEQEPWMQMEACDRGIAPLRQKLNATLLRVIARSLPNLRAEMQACLAKNKQVLRSLGSHRTTVKQHREFLVVTAREVERLLQTAVESDYHKSHSQAFFENARNKLRDATNAHSDAFSTQLYNTWPLWLCNGTPSEVNDLTQDCQPRVLSSSVFHKENISKHATPEERHDSRSFEANKSFTSLSINDHASHGVAGNGDRTTIQMKDVEVFLKELAVDIQHSRGLQLTGLLPPNIVPELFRRQTEHWEERCKDYVGLCSESAELVLRNALQFVAGKHTGTLLWRELGSRYCQEKRQEVMAKVEELLWPYQRSHLISYNEAQQKRPVPWLKGSQVLKVGQELSGAKTALERAGQHAAIALDCVIDNMATLAVERCLLSSLPDAIPSEKFIHLDDEVIIRLGRASDQEEKQRHDAQAKINVLEEVIEMCELHCY